MRFTELTEWQRESLFRLVEYQAAADHEVVFASDYRNRLELREEFPDTGYLGNTAEIAGTPAESLVAWADAKYIALLEIPNSPNSLVRLTLRKEAFDYRDFMHRPAPVRFLLRAWWKLTGDWPTFIYAVFGGALVVLIEKILERLF